MCGLVYMLVPFTVSDAKELGRICARQSMFVKCVVERNLRVS